MIAHATGHDCVIVVEDLASPNAKPPLAIAEQIDVRTAWAERYALPNALVVMVGQSAELQQPDDLEAYQVSAP
jgi:hypothetical protein